MGGEENPFLENGGYFLYEFCLRRERDAAHSVSSSCSRVHHNKMSSARSSFHLVPHLASSLHFPTESSLVCEGYGSHNCRVFPVSCQLWISFFSLQVVCGPCCWRRPVLRPRVSLRVTQQCTMEPVCQCPPPPNAHPRAQPDARPPHASVVPVAHNVAMQMCTPLHTPHPVSAPRYFLDLGCQLMSCQTGWLCAILQARYEKEGGMHVLLSFCRLVWSVLCCSECVSEAWCFKTAGWGSKLRERMRSDLAC